MKKVIVALCALIVGISGFAKEVEVTEGKALMKKREGLVFVTFNWENALWDKETPIKEQWGEEYSKYVTEGEKAFIATFNEKAKKLTTTEHKEEANYLIDIEFTNFDYFFSAMSFVPGHKHKVWANITLIDCATGEILCKIRVTELDGDRDLIKFDSFPKTMQRLAGELTKQK